MKHLTRNQIKRLTQEPEHLCISLYMPLYGEATDERHQNPIRYKNLLREAKQKVAEWGDSADAADEMLAKIEEVDWSEVVKGQRRGLAIFLSKSSQRIFGIPYEIPEYVFVHNRFYLRPILPYLSNNGSFYVLALTRDKIRFFEATQHSMQEITLEGLPESLTENAIHDGRAGHTGFRAVAHDGKGTVVHQPGGVMDDVRIDSEAYLRLANTEVTKYLENENAPVVLVGSEAMVAEYRALNAYPNLLDSAVTSDPASLSDEAVHDKALHASTLALQEVRNTAFEMYHDLKGSGKTSSDLTEVLKAADASRVRDLFMKLDIQCWGTFDRTNQKVSLQTERTPQAEDLMDLAAYLTLQRNGSIWAGLNEQTPDGADIAAVYRF